MDDYIIYINGHEVHTSDEAFAYLEGLRDSNGPTIARVETIFLNGKTKNIVKVTFFSHRSAVAFFVDESDRWDNSYIDGKFALRRLIHGRRNGYMNIPR